MDTTLEGRKVTWLYAILYGLCAELVPIIANLLYVYVWGNLINPELNLSFTQEYMTDIGALIFQTIGFLTYFGTAFWIAKRSRVRTLYNGFRMVLAGIVLEFVFYWIVGVEFLPRYAFSFLTYFVAIALAAITPPVLKGRKTHRKDWDAHKDEEYEKKKRR